MKDLVSEASVPYKER